MPGAYTRSKLIAEQCALEAAASGLHVIVANPTMPIGNDRNLTPPALMLQYFINRPIQFYVADAAYDAVEKAQAEAWRTLGGSNTQSRGRAFTGQRGSKPGDPCSIDGASGVLGYNAEGELVCQVQSSNDDPEKALSDAYQDHINYLNHAWRMGK